MDYFRTASWLREGMGHVIVHPNERSFITVKTDEGSEAGKCQLSSGGRITHSTHVTAL